MEDQYSYSVWLRINANLKFLPGIIKSLLTPSMMFLLIIFTCVILSCVIMMKLWLCWNLLHHISHELTPLMLVCMAHFLSFDVNRYLKFAFQRMLEEQLYSFQFFHVNKSSIQSNTFTRDESMGSKSDIQDENKMYSVASQTHSTVIEWKYFWSISYQSLSS